MITYPPGYKEALRAGAKQSCLFKIFLGNGGVKYFTDAAESCEIEGIVYRCEVGLTKSSFTVSTGLESSDIEVNMLFVEGLLSKQEVKAGLFENASYEMYEYLPENPSLGTVFLSKGKVGEPEIYRLKVRFNFHGLLDILNNATPRNTSPNCPWHLGDMAPKRCQKNIASFIVNTAVTSVISPSQLTANASTLLPSIRVFSYGFILFTSGANQGLKFPVGTLAYSAPVCTISLWEATPYPMAVSDTFLLFPGCDKTMYTCNSDYNNSLNFGGQPFVPGEVKVINGIQ